MYGPTVPRGRTQKPSSRRYRGDLMKRDKKKTNNKNDIFTFGGEDEKEERKKGRSLCTAPYITKQNVEINYKRH